MQGEAHGRGFSQAKNTIQWQPHASGETNDQPYKIFLARAGAAGIHLIAPLVFPMPTIAT